MRMQSITISNLSHAQKHHNQAHRATLKYVHHELTVTNERWDREYKANGNPKSLNNYYTAIKKNVKEKTGRAIQEKASEKALQEAVVVIDEQTTMDDLKRFAKAMEDEFGFTAIQIHIHRDEGYLKRREKLNLHAHIVFETIDRATGKTWKPKADRGSRMQDIASETLGMVRGTPKSITKKKGLDAMEYKEEQARQHLEVLVEQKETIGEEVEEARREKEAVEREAEALVEQAEKKLSEIETAKDIRKREASKALDGAFGAVTGYFKWVGKKAEEAREAIREHEERSQEIEIGKTIIERAKELTGEKRPQLEEIKARHTRETFFGNKKTDEKAVLEDYAELAEYERNNIKSLLEAEQRRRSRDIQNLKQQITQKDDSIKKLKDTLAKERDRFEKVENGIADILGEKFKQLFDDCKRYFSKSYDNLKTSILLYLGKKLYGESSRDERLNEEYSARQDEGRLRINGYLMDDWEKERQRIEEKIDEEESQSRGYSRSYGMRR